MLRGYLTPARTAPHARMILPCSSTAPPGDCQALAHQMTSRALLHVHRNHDQPSFGQGKERREMRPVLLDRFDVFDLLVAAPGSLTGVADWLRSHVLRQAIWMKESCQRRSDQERPGQSLLSGRARLIAAAIA